MCKKLHGREIILADDFSIHAGHADGALYEKTSMEKLALTIKLPMIKLLDRPSRGCNDNQDERLPIRPTTSWNGLGRQTAQHGNAQPWCGAARVVSCHFSVMAGNVGSLSWT